MISMVLFTLSPVHVCAYDRIRKGAGIAVRFPRFIHRWRKDKAPEDATAVGEIVDMYRSQLKRIGNYEKPGNSQNII